MIWNDGYITIKKRKGKRKVIVRKAPFQLSWPDPEDDTLTELNFNSKEIGKGAITLYMTDATSDLRRVKMIASFDHEVIINWT